MSLEVSSARECIAAHLSALKPAAETQADKLSAIASWRSNYREKMEGLVGVFGPGTTVDEIFDTLKPAAAAEARPGVARFGENALEEITALETIVSSIEELHGQYEDVPLRRLICTVADEEDAELCLLLNEANTSMEFTDRIFKAREALQTEKRLIEEALRETQEA